MTPAEATLTIVPERLERAVEAIFAAAGSNAHEASRVATQLVGANLAGHDSHGVGMVPRYVKSWIGDELQLNQHVATVQAAGPMLSLDGCRGMGPVIAFEAMQQAIGKFRSRLAETYSNLAVQPVPEKIFRAASMKQVHVEKRMHSFGAYEEPMYRVYLQYLDSAETREPVIEAWKSTFAGNRAIQYGVGFGVLAALLGVVSAGLRAVSAAKGSRGRAVMTALAFAGLGLVGLLFVA